MKSYFLATVIVTSRGMQSSLDDVKCEWLQGESESKVIASQCHAGEVDVFAIPGDDTVMLGDAGDTRYVCGEHIADVIRVLYEEVVQQPRVSIDVTRQYKTE